MTEYKKQGIIYISIAIFILTQITIVALHFFGRDLKVDIQLNFNFAEQFIITALIYFANLYLFIKIATKSNKAFLQCLFFIPFYLALFIFEMQATPLPTALIILFVILIQIKSKKIKFIKFLLRILLFSLITSAWQLLTMYIKAYLGLLNFEANMILSIDYLIILYLVMKGGELHATRFKLVFLSIRRVLRIRRQNSAKARKEVNRKDFSKSQNAIRNSIIMITQGFQMALFIYIGAKFDILLELGLAIITFWIFRFYFGESWHSKKLEICTAIAILLFFTISKGAMPYEISTSLLIITAMFMALVMNLFQEQQSAIYRKNCAIIKMAAMATPEKVIQYNIRSLGLSKRHAEAEIKRTIEGKTVKQTAEEMNFSEDSIKRFAREINRAKEKKSIK